jgi:hypothetical protein
VSFSIGVWFLGRGTHEEVLPIEVGRDGPSGGQGSQDCLGVIDFHIRRLLYRIFLPIVSTA